MEALLTDSQKALRDEVRAFVRDDVPRQLLLDMDAGEKYLTPASSLRPPLAAGSWGYASPRSTAAGGAATSTGLS